jgi:hypothetical protein
LTDLECRKNKAGRHVITALGKKAGKDVQELGGTYPATELFPIRIQKNVKKNASKD